MKITLLCSDPSHPVNAHLESWANRNNDKHQISLVRRKSELPGGDLLFLISCSELVSASDCSAYTACLVLHASDLPRGRGWSPHIWEIEQGAQAITLSLLEAAENVDSGRIWKKLEFDVPKHALWDEINDVLFRSEIELIDFAVNNYKNVNPKSQEKEGAATYYPRRTPENSRLDPSQSIAAQFDRIRVCDPNRYPAFFELHGYRYKVTIEKIAND